MEHFAAERKKKVLPFETAWMELEHIMLNEISQVVKDKHHMISPINGISSAKQISKQNRTRGMKTRNRLTTARGEGGGG